MIVRTAAALAAAALVAAMPAQAAVRYTFTEYDGNTPVYQLSQTLADFLDPDTHASADFGPDSIVIDPWAAFGFRTLELHAGSSSGPAHFSALSGWITFAGADFCGNRYPQYPVCDTGNIYSAISFDMAVIDRAAGTWWEGPYRLDIQVVSVPEPATYGLVAGGLALLAWRRRSGRG